MTDYRGVDMDMVTMTRAQYEADIREAKADALRDLAHDLDASRIPVRDGGRSYINLFDRADEVEAGR